MVQAFTTILSMSKTACFIIAVVLLARLLLKKAPKVISYALWSVVFIRLLCPFSFSSSFYGMPEQTYAPVVTLQQAPVEAIPQTETTSEPDLTAESKSEEPLIQRSLPALSGIWLAGIGGMLLYGGFTYLRLHKKLVCSVPYKKGIYWADYLESPFVMGLVHPKIYLPSTLGEKELPYILAHEEHHIKRLDHLAKPLAFLALCLHWFNPFVWLSFILFCKDMEMSCDEAVLRQLGEGVRADYAQSLLSLATRHRIITGTPLAFGEGDTKGRIKNMKNWKKPVVWIVVLAVAACVLLSVFLLTNRKDAPEEPSAPTTAQVTEWLDSRLLDAGYLLEGRKTADGQVLVWDEASFAQTTISGQPCYTMALCFADEENRLYASFAVSEDGEIVYQENLASDTDADRWQSLVPAKQETPPKAEPIPLTEETADLCMTQVLKSFIMQQDGTVSFTIPNSLPQSDEKNIALSISLYAYYRTDDNSHDVQEVLQNESFRTGGETYTGKLDLQLGQLYQVVLRVALIEDSGSNNQEELYPAKGLTLTPPFPYGEPLKAVQDTISASQDGRNVTVDLAFVNSPAAQVTFALPDGISLGSVQNDPDSLGYTLTAESGNEVGTLFFMELAADREDLENINSSQNQLPMQVYAGVALPNHIQYENYTVHKHTQTSAAATVQISSQNLSLIGSKYSAAAEVPFANEQNAVLFYDYEKLPVFLQIAFGKESVSQDLCAEIANSIAVQ